MNAAYATSGDSSQLLVFLFQTQPLSSPCVFSLVVQRLLFKARFSVSYRGNFKTQISLTYAAPDLSFWYTYKELATRGAVVFSTSALAGAFNGLICYAISKDLNGHNGWLAWRWIFLIEGIMPITFSFVVFTLLPVSPEKLKFGFSKAESKLASQRSLRSHNNPDAKMEWKKILTPLLEIHFWLIAIMACAGHFCLSSLSNFLPAIIKVSPF